MPADHAISALALQRAQSHQAILGGRLPTIRDFFLGAPFRSGSIELDYQAWHDSLDEIDNDDIVAAMKFARTHFDGRSLHELLVQLEGKGDPNWSRRVLVYLACKGDDDARRRLAHVIIAIRSGGAVFWQATAWGLLAGAEKSMDAYYDTGLRTLQAVSREVQALADVPEAMEEDDHLLAEDRAEFFSDKPAGASGEPSAGEQLVNALFDKRRPGAVVVGKLPEAVGYKKEIYKGFAAIAGKKLPFAPLRDLAGARRRLQEGWPHASEVIDQIFLPLASGNYARIQPTLLVGTPGSGKSALAMAICRELGLPMHLIGLGGAADSSIGGTSAQWHSARPNVVLQHIVTDRLATIGIVWDEVDKASDNRHNGSAFDSLLGMLEIDQARRFRDPALEVEVDLSHVTHIATANQLAKVPAPLRDRMRVLHVPTPEWQHVGPLVQRIVAEILAQRGMTAWQQPFGQDEMAVLELAWSKSPSFRSFRRVIDDMLMRRESLWGRA